MSNPTILGEIGEKQVAMELKRLPSEYITINDVLLSMGNFSSQIDHIVLSPKGIFVIETKNYTGWIFGNKSNREWTKVYYRDKYRFYNPILQNDKHISVLKEFLSKEVENIEKIPFYSLIVFPNPDCELKEVPDCAIKSDILRYTIQYTKPKARLNESEINKISNYIKDNNMSSNKQYVDKHIVYAKTSKAKAEGTYEEYKKYSNVSQKRKLKKHRQKRQKQSSNGKFTNRMIFFTIFIIYLSLVGSLISENGFNQIKDAQSTISPIESTNIRDFEGLYAYSIPLTSDKDMGFEKRIVIEDEFTEKEFLDFIELGNANDTAMFYYEIFTSKEAVLEHMEKKDNIDASYSDEYKENFIGIHIKNLVYEDEKHFGDNKFIWKQQIGAFSDKYGQELDLKNKTK